jgi:hypothetical protein
MWIKFLMDFIELMIVEAGLKTNFSVHKIFLNSGRLKKSYLSVKGFLFSEKFSIF